MYEENHLEIILKLKNTELLTRKRRNYGLSREKKQKKTLKHNTAAKFCLLSKCLTAFCEQIMYDTYQK